MESSEENKLTNKNRLIGTENRLTAIRVEQVGGLGEGDGTKQKKKKERNFIGKQ